MDSTRAILITYTKQGRPYRASGLHLCEDLVLTAEHCAGGTGYQGWRENTPYPAKVVWSSGTRDVDLALLSVGGLPEVEPMPLALLDHGSDERLENCTCLCYPAFKRLDPEQGVARGEDRMASMVGTIPLADNWVARSATPISLLIPNASLVIHADRSVLPHHDGSSAQISAAWSGASGGGVLAPSGSQQYCVGVISARQVKETPSSLHLTPWSAVHGLDDRRVSDLAALLSIPCMVDPPRAVGPDAKHQHMNVGRRYRLQLPTLPIVEVSLTDQRLRRLDARKSQLSRETIIAVETQIMMLDLGISELGRGAQ